MAPSKQHRLRGLNRLMYQQHVIEKLATRFQRLMQPQPHPRRQLPTPGDDDCLRLNRRTALDCTVWCSYEREGWLIALLLQDIRKQPTLCAHLFREIQKLEAYTRVHTYVCIFSLRTICVHASCTYICTCVSIQVDHMTYL